MTNNQYSKHKEYGHVYGPTISTPPLRSAWAYLSKPKKAAPPKPGQNQMPDRYELTLLGDKKDPKFTAWAAEVQKHADAMLALFNEKNKAPLGAIKAFQDGDSDTFDTTKYPFLAGKLTFVAKNETQPAFVGKGGSADLIPASQIVGGNVVIAVVRMKLTAKGGIGYTLDLVQNVKDDGQRYGYTPIDPASLVAAISDEQLIGNLSSGVLAQVKTSSKEDALAHL